MSDPRWIRAPHVRIVDHGDDTVIVARDGSLRRFESDSAALVRTLLDHSTRPVTRAQLFAAIADATGTPLDANAQLVVQQAIDILRATGVLLDATDPAPIPFTGARRRVVLGITGAVATLHAPMLIGLLQRRYEVQVVATRKALRFVGRIGLEALTHRPVRAGVWETRADRPVPHIEIAEWADLVLVCPASATTIARIASGSCVDLVSAVAVSTRAPVVIVPSMNAAMHANGAVQRNLANLRDDGRYIVHPSLGVELAQRPDAREPMYGPAPPADDVAAIVHAIFALERSRDGLHVPNTADGWDAVYRSTAESSLPWFEHDADAALFEDLAARDVRDGSFLDVGTGTGVVACAASARGFRVVATDLAASALAIASARAGAEQVTWLLDDIVDSHLRARFRVVHDRGCLHLLPATQHARYAASIAARVAPGGWFALVVHDPYDKTPRGTQRFTRAQLAALVGPSFTLEHERASTLGPGVPARAYLFRRAN